MATAWKDPEARSNRQQSTRQQHGGMERHHGQRQRQRQQQCNNQPNGMEVKGNGNGNDNDNSKENSENIESKATINRAWRSWSSMVNGSSDNGSWSAIQINKDT
jgi:hypothetical protein